MTSVVPARRRTLTPVDPVRGAGRARAAQRGFPLATVICMVLTAATVVLALFDWNGFGDPWSPWFVPAFVLASAGALRAAWCRRLPRRARLGWATGSALSGLVTFVVVIFVAIALQGV